LIVDLYPLVTALPALAFPHALRGQKGQRAGDSGVIDDHPFL